MFAVIAHKERTVYLFERKLDAVYKHNEYRRGDKVQFKEGNLGSLPGGYEVIKS